MAEYPVFDAAGFRRFVEQDGPIIHDAIHNLNNVGEQLQAALQAAPALLEGRTPQTANRCADYLQQIAVTLAAIQHGLLVLDRDLGSIGLGVNHAALGLRSEALQAAQAQLRQPKGRRTR